MQLLQSWKSSLALLLPRNATMFLLVTIKAFFDTCKTWLKNFWWLLGLYIILDGVSLWLYQYVFGLSGEDRFLMYQHYFDILEYSSLVVAVLMLLTLFLTVRPSTKLKNMSYYFDYKWHTLWFLATSIIGYFVIKYLDLLSLIIQYYKALGMAVFSPVIDMVVTILLDYVMLPFIPLGRFLGATNSLMYAPFFVLFVFALLDTTGSFFDAVKSKLRSLKMIVYNYPLLWILVWICTMIVSGINYATTMIITHFLGTATEFLLVAMFVLDTLFFLLLTIFYIFYLCLMSNFYTKQVHEQFKRFF